MISFVKVAAVELDPDGIPGQLHLPRMGRNPFNDPTWEFLGGKEAAEPPVEHQPIGPLGQVVTSNIDRVGQLGAIAAIAHDAVPRLPASVEAALPRSKSGHSTSDNTASSLAANSSG